MRAAGPLASPARGSDQTRPQRFDRLRLFWTKNLRNRSRKGLEDFLRGPRGVHHLKAIRFSQPVENADQASLVAHEAVEHVPAKVGIQAALPIIEGPAADDHARN